MLLKAGADVNIKAHNVLTALMIAARKGYYEIVKLLKDAGAVDEATKKPVFI